MDIDSPELVRHDRADSIDDTFLVRTSSASKDPGAIGPIVWNLNKQMFSTEGNFVNYIYLIFPENCLKLLDAQISFSIDYEQTNNDLA